ncbi:MAG TPA: hypothetical protein VL326_11435 [Kofleriaceae bacterium]|nr:hypothetical protein [Kofleriaceae bacterium]
MRRALALVALVGCGRVGFDELCGLDGPCVSMRINDGAPYARAPRLTVKVSSSTDDAGQEVFLGEAPCELPTDAVWKAHADDAPVPFLVEPVDGPKHVCAWVRDATGIGFGDATIQYETLNLPQIEKLDVVALDTTRARATWTASDVEGLAAQPIDLEIRTDMPQTPWMPLAMGLGDASGTGSYDFDIPAAPFVVRAIVTDRAGNRGVPAVSDVVGSASWHVYAGIPMHELGIGMSPRALRLEFAENSAYMFAVDPLTMDAYVLQRDAGIIKVDGATGNTSLLISIGTLNLPDDGPLPATAAVGFNPSLRVGPDSNLYVATGGAAGVSATIYQIDPVTLHVRKYLGAGTVNDQTATPSTVYVAKQIWNFDEDGTLYFLTSCTPGSQPSPLRMRVMKALHNTDGTAGAISVVAGDCTTNAPPTTGPVNPLAVPLPDYRVFSGIGTIAAFDHGKTIYLGSYTSPVWKIVDGQLWPSDLVTATEGTLGYDPATQKVLVGTGPLEAFTPGGGSPTDPYDGLRMHDDGVAGCSEDGVDAASACVHVAYGVQGTAARTYVADGTAINAFRAYRVRFVDRAGRMQTYIGGHSFYGEGLDRRSMRARIAAIQYKPATAMNQAAFPAGLYFTDPLDLVFGYIDPATERVSILWGNKSGSDHVYTPGEPIGTDKSLGFPYGGGNLKPFAFGADGLPILRYGPNERYATLVSVNASHQAIPFTNGMIDWEVIPDGADPATADLWPYGGDNNLTYYAGNLFLIGGYTTFNTTATLKRLDFVTHQVTRLMGVGADGYSPDTATPANASLSGTCHNELYSCQTVYRPAEDRLYFSEDTRLRYLTTPLGATQTLGTLFTVPGVAIRNFTFRPDGSQVWYERDGLRCHDISSGSAVCNDAVVGPPPVLGAINAVSDQMTWIDNNTLLISTYNGLVLQYAVQ